MVCVEDTNNAETAGDQELIAAINEGDEVAFEALYYRHRDWVVNLAYRWTEGAVRTGDSMCCKKRFTLR